MEAFARSSRTLTLVALGVLLCRPASAATTQILCVDPAGLSGCATSISAAVASITAKKAEITVDSGVYPDTIAINTGIKPKKLTLTITGAGADLVTVKGAGGSVFTIGPKADVTLMNMTIADGVGQALASGGESAGGESAGGESAGGGIFAVGATVTIAGCIITANQANLGAGIYASDSNVTIASSTINANTAPSLTNSDGGGIYFNATKASKLTINNSTIESNSAFDGAGLMIVNPNATAAKPIGTVVQSTISNNSAVSDGGGILVEDAKLTMDDSTISGNSQSDSNGQGGGIFSTSGNVALNNVTIADNTAAGFGGGIDIDSSNHKFTLSNTIVADNVAGASPDCFATGKAMDSRDYNLIGDIGGCTISGQTTHNLTGVSPMLAGLGDNGGNPAPDVAPETQALLAGSPALGAGNPGTPNGKNGHCEPTDETGLIGAEARNKGDCDIGAYQLPD